MVKKNGHTETVDNIERGYRKTPLSRKIPESGKNFEQLTQDNK